MTDRRRPFALVALVALLASLAVPAAAEPTPGTDGSDGGSDTDRLLVTYTSPVDGAAEAATFSTAEVVADDHVTTSSVQVLEFEQPSERDRAARDLAGRADVLSVEPDQIIRPHQPEVSVLDEGVVGSGASGDGAVASTASGDGAFVSTDGGDGDDGTWETVTENSWGVANDGSSINGRAARAGIDVGATQAWPKATGDGVVVAVIDTGVDISHPLLVDRIWENPKEVADGRDTDGNGFVDDVNGWNFARDTNRVFDSAEADAHGTHVAGVIAGARDTRHGFAGVAPDALIMPVKFIDGDGGRLSDAIAGIRYAIDNGADVINASWGAPQESSALERVLRESPIPVVASAGNFGAPLEEQPAYPGGYDLETVISVAALEPDGSMANYSSTSRDLVDVTAPGSVILGPWPDRQMARASGTSQAAPHIAGLVALALERHPNLTPAEVSEAVRATVRPLHAAEDTRAGGLGRAPGVLDHLGTAMPACNGGGDVAFTDVSKDSPHHGSVACLVSLGITQGTSSTSFGSADGLTRAQIATLVARAFEQADALPDAPAVGRFDDVRATNVHRDSIESLASIGVVRGTSTSRFSPSETTTRAELAAIVARAAEYLSDGEVRAVGPVFPDTVSLAEEVEIQKASGLRIILGLDDGNFGPETPVRRDQAASMVSRLLDRWVQQGLLRAE